MNKGMQMPMYCDNCGTDLTLKIQQLDNSGKPLEYVPFGIKSYPLVGDSRFLYFCNLDCFREFLGCKTKTD